MYAAIRSATAGRAPAAACGGRRLPPGSHGGRYLDREDANSGWIWATTHAKQRALERLGFEPDEWDWRTLALSILDTKAGTATDAILLKVDGNGAETWLTRLRGREVRVVWSPLSAQVVTVMAHARR